MHTGRALNRHILSGIVVRKNTEAAREECRLIAVTVNEVQALRSGPSTVRVPNVHSGATPVSKYTQ